MIFIIPLFIPFLLLLESILSLNFLLAILVFVLFPIVSKLIGPLCPSDIIVRGRLNKAVANISLCLYPCVSLFAIYYVLIRFLYVDFSVPSSLFVFFSLWLVASLNLPVLHEMIHRKDVLTKLYCEALLILFVFPIFKEDHLAHHVREGHDGSSDYGNVGVSVYRYLLCRPIWVVRDVWHLNRLVLCDIRLVRFFIILRLLLSCALWIYIVRANGKVAFLWLIIIFLVHLSYGVISYVQHYGLSAVEGDFQFSSYSWSHDCLIQAILLYGNSLHHDHHRSKDKNFTELCLYLRSLITPYSYLYLFFIAFFPRFFDRIMREELRKYHQSPSGLDGGRHYFC